MARTLPRLPAALRIPGKREPAEPARSAPRLPAVLRRSRNRRRTDPAPARRRLPALSRRSREPAAQPGSPAGRHALPLPVRLLAMLVAFACMVAFAVVLARLTLQPSPASVPLTHSNLHPGRSLNAYLQQGQFRDTVKQIGGNVLLGVPFGVLVPVLAPRARGVLRVLALTALVMLMVELAQGALVTGRAFDIDDVILNTGGALLGWLLLGRRLGRGVHRRVRQPAAE
ncbi:VanZ family protein [Streptomyces echinatus]|uniref:Glycopeptide antibiotics resistance protein n=1 Tax=Streptomyces echinatus TaxID=67293 RepID=A0A7W9PV21_9ACTN|nr:VanZ family protein [Streptomyces echinatus]MBB5928474.1 glycopeptide antibiotics resistance protein [Streptomyces echinatus]